MGVMPVLVTSLLAITLFHVAALRPNPGQEPSGSQDPVPLWQALVSGSEASLRGLSPISARVCWASGSGGTVLRTTNGRTFERRPVDGAEALDFRDIEAFDAERAIVLSAGQPARVYRTQDGGDTWSMVYENQDERAFFDAMDFADDKFGLAFSDPIEGKLLVIRTLDGGRTWQELPRKAFPASPEGEAGFAASGTCLRVDEEAAYIGLGGTAGARLFATKDRGNTWTVVKTPIRSGLASAGIFSVAIQGREGVLIGGDYAAPDDTQAVAAWTDDGGATWTLAEEQPTGFRSCVIRCEIGWMAVGTNGTDVSGDGGKTWDRLSSTGWNVALKAKTDGSVWAAGSKGRIATLLTAQPAGGDH